MVWAQGGHRVGMSDINFDKLVCLHHELLHHENINTESMLLLKSAFLELSSGTVKTLDEAFGFYKTAGKSSIGTRLRIHLRTEKIIELLRFMRPTCRSDWDCSVKASKELNSYHSHAWHRVSKLSMIPCNTEKVRALITEVFQLDSSPPMSPSYLYSFFCETPLLSEFSVTDNDKHKLTIGMKDAS